MVDDEQLEDDCCDKCKPGKAAFEQCVIVEGSLRGACGNHHYNGNGEGCSVLLGKFLRSLLNSYSNFAHF